MDTQGVGAASSGGRAKVLADLRWVPRWASHLGCIEGCLNHLGIEVSDAWLFGATGHAFVINIAPGLCASGPTDWDARRLSELGRNIGYRTDGIEEYCPDRERGLPGAQERCWDYVRGRIDENLPCYGWELDVPEFYVIYGYDETGYYVSGPDCDEGRGPVPWRKLGTSEIGVVSVSSVSPAAPAEVPKTVSDALSFALDVGYNRRRWTDSAGGLVGYDVWIRTLRAGRAGRFGLGYNAAVWAESRRFAVEFLKEAQQRLPDNLDDLFGRAVGHYEVVARALKTVSDVYPFRKDEPEAVAADDRVHTTMEALDQAREAEAAGLGILAELVARLGA
jgi:hypothetical protein